MALIEEEADWAALVEMAVAETNLAKELHKRLLAGAENELYDKKLEPALSPKRVAQFLASVSYAQKNKLAKTIKWGLHSLGIESTKNHIIY